MKANKGGDSPEDTQSLRATNAASEEPAYPVRVSENGRYFVDRNGSPVFWLGTTQWQIFRDNTLEEARTVLAGVKNKGFVFIQAMLAGVGDGTKPNVYGDKPWLNDDPLTPNPAYFQNVDAVIRSAQEMNLVFSHTLYHQRWRKIITPANGRRWAYWLARRYRDTPNIVWSMTPEARQEFVPVLRELAAGLREGDGGRHLITFKPDPAPYSSSFLHEEAWLDFNSMQTWKSVELICPMVSNDYLLTLVKPVLMAEGAYEAGTEYGFDVTPLWVRRQAYYSYLLGAHHTYGHNDSWRVLPTWKQALDAPGAVQMGVLKRIITSLEEWWSLAPDQAVFADGGSAAGQMLNLAARHRGGRWTMVYLAEKASISLHMDRVAGGRSVQAAWVDPRDGRKMAIGVFPGTGVRAFATPEGWEDALLIVQASTSPDPSFVRRGERRARPSPSPLTKGRGLG
jgi:hypothetical protein